MKRVIAIVALATLVGGCAAVLSDEPLGGVVRIDPLEWEGVWTNIDNADVLRIRVVDADNGELLITDGNPTETAADEIRVFVRSHGDWTYLNLACGTDDCAPEDDGARYLWAVAENSGDVLLIFLPDVAKFEQLVAEGELPGELERSNVQLHALEPHHYDLIQSEDRATPLDWRQPLVFRRSAAAIEVSVP